MIDPTVMLVRFENRDGTLFRTQLVPFTQSKGVIGVYAGFDEPVVVYHFRQEQVVKLRGDTQYICRTYREE